MLHCNKNWELIVPHRKHSKSRTFLERQNQQTFCKKKLLSLSCFTLITPATPTHGKGHLCLPLLKKDQSQNIASVVPPGFIPCWSVGWRRALPPALWERFAAKSAAAVGLWQQHSQVAAAFDKDSSSSKTPREVCGGCCQLRASIRRLLPCGGQTFTAHFTHTPFPFPFLPLIHSTCWQRHT